MKTNMLNPRKMLLLVIVGLALHSLGAQGATLAAAPDDLILGFRATSGQGAAFNLEVDLGSVATFYQAAPGSTIPLPGLVIQDLVDTYGASWYSRSGLYFGAAAAYNNSGADPQGKPAATVWVSRANGQPAWSRASFNSLSGPSTTIISLYTGNDGSLDVAPSTTNSGSAAVIDTSLPGSWTKQDLKGAGTSFGYFNPTVDSVVSNLATSSQVVLQLYELQPGSGAGTLLGNLILTRTGLSFHAAGGSVAPVIGVSGNLAFGAVTTGATASATLTITNSGNATLTVTNITYPSGFSGPFSGAIAAGSASNVTVTFAPVAVTTYNGTVTVNSDATSGTSTISASGTGKVAAVPTVTISTVASPVNGGTVTGSGAYPVGTNVQITATANNGWTFSSWSDGSVQSPHTITVPSTNITYTATFVQQTAAIGVGANPSEGGAVSGSGTYPVGTNVQITATAYQHWRFTGWNDGNTNATRTITVTAGGANFTATFAAVVSLAPPVILTAPVITNSELVVGNQFIVLAGDTNVFNVGAADTVDNTLLRYQWAFGDGATSVWSAAAIATHVYATNYCGQYTASVIVSNTQFAISSNLTVSVACLLPITKLQLGVNFGKSNSDSIGLTAKLNLPEFTSVAQLNGVTLMVDVGDAQLLFPLSNKGRGVNANGSCSLAFTKPSKTKAGSWTLTVALSKGNWRSAWTNYGLDNATHKSPGVLVTVPVTVLVGADAFAVEPQLHYSATVNKTGTAK